MSSRQTPSSLMPQQPECARRVENFPVASLLIARPLRRAVLNFYRFARTADDVADDPELAADEKLARLLRLRTALVEGDLEQPVAPNLVRIQDRYGTGLAEALHLLEAFVQDVGKSRYADWAELLRYCDRSANPVGR